MNPRVSLDEQREVELITLKVVGRLKILPVLSISRTMGTEQEKHFRFGFASARIFPQIEQRLFSAEHSLSSCFNFLLSSIGKAFPKPLYMGESVKFPLQPVEADPQVIP